MLHGADTTPVNLATYLMCNLRVYQREWTDVQMLGHDVDSSAAVYKRTVRHWKQVLYMVPKVEKQVIP